MSYQKFFSQLALSAAVAATGVAHAEAPSSAATSNNVSKQTPIELPAPNRILGQRITDTANLPKVKACFQELSVEEKPLQYMKATDAKNIVDCTDQKNLTLFLANPVTENKAVLTVAMERVGYEVASGIANKPKFAQSVAANCNATGKVHLNEFASCANATYADAHKNDGLKAAGIILSVLGALGVGVYAMVRSSPARDITLDAF